MKRILSFTFLLTALFACQREYEVPVGSEGTLTVAASSSCVKSIYDGTSILWEKGDRIAVFEGGEMYYCTSDASGADVTFKGDVPSADSYVMMYPYDKSAILSGSSISANIPSVQKVRPGTFAPDANLSVAISAKTGEPNIHSAIFRNVGAYLKFQIDSEDSGVSKIIFRPVGSEKLSGNISVELSSSDEISVGGGSIDSLAVIPVTGEVFVQGTYYAVVLPTELSGGLKVTVVNADGSYEDYKFEDISSLKRNEILTVTTPFGRNLWSSWTDAASVKALLEKAREKGRVYTSQYSYYDMEHIKSITGNSRYKTYGGFPLIYGLDFFRMSGTYYDATYTSNNRKRALSIIKDAWEQVRAIPSFSWHLESPYASIENPELGESVQGCGFCYQNRDVYSSFPMEHRYQVNEILENTGLAVTGQTCGDWFDSRVREVADIINSLVDSQGRPIPMIFRLWHELEDWWAWWQVHDTKDDQYRRFFRLTVDKFREYCPNAQILWVYCTDKASSQTSEAYMKYYPGDDYVDIMGYDDYNLVKVEERDKSITRAKVVSAAAREHGKVAMLCETLRAAKETTANQDIFFQDFVWPVVTSEDVSLSIFQVWGGADNTDLRKESFKWWYDNEKTIFSKRY